MSPQELIMIFKDTQKIIAEDPVLQQYTLRTQASSQLYLENYTSPLRTIKGDLKVDVLANTTFQCARESTVSGERTAVLNFANPHEPGGGVLRGAKAQEECLCRCSNLYNALAQPYFQKHYYQYHYQNCDYFFSDRLIYSPNVAVIKSDDTIPQVLPELFFVDVITCAAPYINNDILRTEQELLSIYESRIKNILEVAMSNDVDILILGAFGCGAFHNDPSLMAKAFSNMLIRDEYAQYFKKVKFAIKRTGDFCQNLCSFEEAFYGISVEGNKRRFWM